MNKMEIKSKNILEINVKTKTIKRGDNFLSIEPDTGSWIIYNNHYQELLKNIDKSVTFEKLKYIYGNESWLENAIINLYKANILTINKKPYISPKIYKHYSSYPSLIVLHLTNSCNLRCKYCFADATTGEKMSFTTVKKIIDKVLKLPMNSYCFDFHGGEPLLLFDLIRDTVKYGYKKGAEFNKNIQFIVQTNGTLLTQKVIDFIKENKISVGVSIDGPKDIHDKNRIYLGGRGSFDDVMKGIKLLRQNNVDFGVISVITDFRDFDKILNFFLSNNIYTIKFSTYFNQGRASQIRLSSKEQKYYAMAELKLIDRVIKYNKTNKRNIRLLHISPMLRNILSWKRLDICMRSPCGAGSSMLSVDHNGNIYPCDAMYGIKEINEFIIGNIHNNQSLKDLLDSSPLIHTFKERTVDNIPKCKKCVWKRLCCGGCANESYGVFKSFFRESYLCAYYQIMFENLIWKNHDDFDGVLSLLI